MNKKITLFFVFALLIGISDYAFAGNPDRQGEAGVYELLMNPWARSAGLNGLNTSYVGGVEAMRINVAGISRINKTEINLGYTDYFNGSNIGLNSFGFAQRIGKSGTIAATIMAVDFGDISVTTEDAPDGTGSTYSPSFINIGVGYAHQFENKISVGVLFRGVSERIADLSGGAIAIDAGVQYVTGVNDQLKVGISLRNVGSRMRFQGDGLVTNTNVSQGGFDFSIAAEERAADFELQSLLAIGASYDFYFAEKHKLTVLGNFTSNAFSQDQIGGGVEYTFNDLLVLRGGYRFDIDSEDVDVDAINSGLAGGVSIQVPLSKLDEEDLEKYRGRISIDYAYRTSNILNGSHSIGVRLDL